MKKKIFHALAAALLPLAASAFLALPASAEETESSLPSEEEIEQMALDWFDQVTSRAGKSASSSVFEDSDFREFKELYDPDGADDALIRQDYTDDWSWYTNNDQHFATVVSEDYPYYAVDVTTAISARGSYSFDDVVWAFRYQEDGLKFTLQEDKKNILGEKMWNNIHLYPQNYRDALDAGRTAFEVTNNNSNFYWYLKSDRNIKDALVCNPKYLWVDESGYLNCDFLLANGTGENQTVSVHCQITDDSGVICDAEISGTFFVKDRHNQLASFYIEPGQYSSDSSWQNVNVIITPQIY